MIQLSLSAHQTLVIETSIVTLRNAGPVLNGTPLEAWTCEVLEQDREGIELRYTSPALGGGAFRLQAAPSGTQGRSGCAIGWRVCRLT